MIDFYTWTTPNGRKIGIMLEEAGLDYTAHPIDISKGEQFTDTFLKIAPNNKIPAIVDHDPLSGEEPVSVFESGAILVYLAEKSGKFLPSDAKGRAKALEWTFWQAGGLGPMLGQLYYFASRAPEKIPHAIERFQTEGGRLMNVLDTRLRDAAFLAGDQFSIADMATYPWVAPMFEQGRRLPGANGADHVERWIKAVSARPGVGRGMNTPAV